MKILLLVFFSSIVFLQSSAQRGDTVDEKLLRAELDSLAKGGYEVNRYHFNPSNEYYFFQLLQDYKKVPVDKLQIRVYGLESEIGRESSDTAMRHMAVTDLVKGIADPRPAINQYVIDRLVDFKDDDFTDQARELLQIWFNSFQNNYNFLFTCGIARVKNVEPQLETLAKKFSNKETFLKNSSAWYASLALARMHPEKPIDSLISYVELYPVKLDRIVRLLQNLAYTRHPQAIHLLHQYVLSTDHLEEMHGRPGIAFNMYALDWLVVYMDHFPLKRKWTGYSEEDIRVALHYLDSIDKR